MFSLLLWPMFYGTNDCFELSMKRFEKINLSLPVFHTYKWEQGSEKKEVKTEFKKTYLYKQRWSPDLRVT